MQPRTSYCPPTRSPRESLGTNENGVPHWVQKPSGRPGSPSRPRPTGVLQSELPQNRWPSGTCGSVRIALAGLPRGTGGTATTPAPSLPRVPAVLDDPVRADPRERGVDAIGAVDVSTPFSGAGAVPHTSQYPSTTVPLQSVSRHVIVSPPALRRASAGSRRWPG